MDAYQSGIIMINYYNQMAPLGFEPTANNSTWI
jgi:hypothetical protein